MTLSTPRSAAGTAGPATPAPAAPRPAAAAAPGRGGLHLPRYERPENLHPAMDHPEYFSTRLRHPQQELVLLPPTLTEVTGPLLGDGRVTAADADLTHYRGGLAQGQRIVVHGRLIDSDGRPVPDALIEVWQANAGGKYRHEVDKFPAPLDPHFNGVGRVVTDSLGRYAFTTIKPGAYPWINHFNAWRPAHIHFSVFGRAFAQRLITQMYFPGDPLFFQDPIFNSIPDERARQRLISSFDHEATIPDWAIAFRWDIVLRGSDATYFESEDPDADDR
ncbi:MAG TPA: protocatechuate 3,4-dioxygenase subunit beta [Kineosporiaceae bacterium]